MKKKRSVNTILFFVIIMFAAAPFAQGQRRAFVPLGLPHGSLVKEDINGDGWNELIITEAGKISIFWSDNGSYSKKPDQVIVAIADQNDVQIGDFNGDKHKDSESITIRNKAYTYLKEVMDEVRETGKYVFWQNHDRYVGYTSQYWKRKNRKTPVGPEPLGE